MTDCIVYDKPVDMESCYRQAFHHLRLELFTQAADRLREYLKNPEAFIPPVVLEVPIKTSMIDKVIIDVHFREKNFRIQYNYYDPYRVIAYPQYIGSSKITHHKLQCEEPLSNDNPTFQRDLEQVINQITDTIAEFEYRRFSK